MSEAIRPHQRPGETVAQYEERRRVELAALEGMGEPGAPSNNGARPGKAVLDPRDPMGAARELATDCFMVDGRSVLVDWRRDVRCWNGSYYADVEAAALRSITWDYLDDALKPGKEGSEPFKPTSTRVNEVMDALRAVAFLDGSIDAPSWIPDDVGRPPARELLPCGNGLLHLPTGELQPHTPDYFTTYALPYDFDPDAPEPVEWIRFLEDLWGGVRDEITTLQEIFGYLVAGETRYQKIFMLVGPRRSGKGTIARILRDLLGTSNVAGPTLSSLAGSFGLQPLVGKPLAIISDARLSGRSDMAIIVERLLSISGEDALTVDRKHRDSWTGQLPTRFLVLTNELPRLADSSGALASRFLTIAMTKSWYGREDLYLYDRLKSELPGILSWALEGWERLLERGHFVTPASSAQVVQALEDLGSPVGAFVRECCAVEPGAEVETGALYTRWRKWCEQHGRSHAGTEQTFGRDIRAAVPGLETASRRSGPDRWRAYVGIRIDP